MSRATVFYGEITCEVRCKNGNACPHKAYFQNSARLPHEPKYVCGQHKKPTWRGANAHELPRNPAARKNEENRLMAQRASTALAQAANLLNGARGRVMVSNMRMMHAPEYVEGFVSVFPNYRHAQREDGVGCAQLSPKSLGPVTHRMPGLPVAVSIENYHQYAKVFLSELEGDGTTITAACKAERAEAYASDVPQRHKPAAGGKNVPLFSVYYDADGAEHRFTYLQCRWFYCYWYARLATKTDEFRDLEHRLNAGWNLNLTGYDGYPVTRTLYEHYTDTTRPFGHELVLYSLLVGERPWERYRAGHAALYAPFVAMFASEVQPGEVK